MITTIKGSFAFGSHLPGQSVVGFASTPDLAHIAGWYAECTELVRLGVQHSQRDWTESNTPLYTAQLSTVTADEILHLVSEHWRHAPKRMRTEDLRVARATVYHVTSGLTWRGVWKTILGTHSHIKYWEHDDG